MRDKPYYISKRTLYCQKAMRHIITALQIQQCLGTRAEGWPETKQSHRWNESTWGWNPIVQIINDGIGPMFFVSQIPRDEMVQSISTRKKIYMEDEDTWGLPEVRYCYHCYWPSSAVSVEVMYVSSAEWSNLLTSINQLPETRVCNEGGGYLRFTWGPIL